MNSGCHTDTLLTLTLFVCLLCLLVASDEFELELMSDIIWIHLPKEPSLPSFTRMKMTSEDDPMIW